MADDGIGKEKEIGRTIDRGERVEDPFSKEDRDENLLLKSVVIHEDYFLMLNRFNTFQEHVWKTPLIMRVVADLRSSNLASTHKWWVPTPTRIFDGKWFESSSRRRGSFCWSWVLQFRTRGWCKVVLCLVLVLMRLYFSQAHKHMQIIPIDKFALESTSEKVNESEFV